MRSLKPDARLVTALVVVLATVSLVAGTWYVTVKQARFQRLETSARITASVTNQASLFSEQVNRQLTILEQTLRAMTESWEADPRRFDLRGLRIRTPALEGISRDALLVDENGVVRQATIPEAVGQNVSARDYFRDAAAHAGELDRLFVGPASIDPIMRLWHLNVARSLRHPDGSFAGVIVLDYRVSAMTDLFLQNAVGSGGLVTLIGLGDGKLRAAVGPQTVDPDAIISDSPMFAALQRDPVGVWVGPSAPDSVVRVHGFRRLPGREVAMVVGVDEQEGMRPANDWRREAFFYAGEVSFLALVVVIVVLQGVRQARRRELRFAEDRAILAAANAQLEVARARADAKTEQLETTLAGMTDGVAMVDAHLCLIEWNARFPDVAGVPADILRVGQPMEEILRAQALAGQFGAVDVEREIERRMAALRLGRFGTVERTRPDGRTLELRRKRLPDGGFVTLYSDITSHKLAEATLREAKAIADKANADKSQFVAVVSHEIRTPLNALLNTLRLLADGELQTAQRSLVAMASQSGDALASLINDILDMTRAEAGQLTLRPIRFTPKSLLESAVEVFTAPARQRAISFRIEVAPEVPAELLFDPGRLRQVLLNLLSNAVKFADAGEVLLQASVAVGAAPVARRLLLSVRDPGPAIPEADRGRLFRPFSQLARAREDGAAGSGLGLSICRQLVELMGGSIAAQTWQTPAGRVGNDFQINLPLHAHGEPGAGAAAVGGMGFTPALETAPSSIAPRLPRTRILLVEDVPASQIVTATLLRRERHMVDVVATGEAAVQAVQRTPYDIVFMDIFLPGIGGEEAARQIRAMRGPAAALPIIALTANVTAEDEAGFRNSGMNGLLGKPVSLAEMLMALDRFVWRQRETNLAEDPEPETGVHSMEPEGPVLAAERIAELRGNLEPQLLANMVEECLTDLDHRLPALRRAMNAKAAGAIAAHAHAMVGMAASYGLAALEIRLRAVMTAARAGDLEALEGWIPLIETDIERGADVLRRVIAGEMALPEPENLPA